MTFDTFRNKSGWVLLALVGCAATVLLVRAVEVRHAEAELLRIDDSRLASRPDILSLARTVATPAYAKHCASCHGADMSGDSATGAPNLIDADWIYSGASPTRIERTIAYGVRSGHGKAHNLADMPAFGQPDARARYRVTPLAPQDVSDLVQYLLHIEEGRAQDPVAAVRGQALYAGRGQCFDCHANDAEGDDFIGAPNLRDRIWIYGDGSPAAIAQSILHGRAGVCPSWERVLPPATIRALAIDIYSRGHASTGKAPPAGT